MSEDYMTDGPWEVAIGAIDELSSKLEEVGNKAIEAMNRAAMDAHWERDLGTRIAPSVLVENPMLPDRYEIHTYFNKHGRRMSCVELYYLAEEHRWVVIEDVMCAECHRFHSLSSRCRHRG